MNLTTLFNGFRPLFQTLSADDVNKLSYQIVQVFQANRVPSPTWCATPRR